MVLGNTWWKFSNFLNYYQMPDIFPALSVNIILAVVATWLNSSQRACILGMNKSLSIEVSNIIVLYENIHLCVRS